MHQFGPVSDAELSELGLKCLEFRFAAELVEPDAVEQIFFGTHEELVEFINRRAESASEEVRRPANNAVRCLEDDLHRAEVITIPVFSDVRPVLHVRWLVTHGEREDS